MMNGKITIARLCKLAFCCAAFAIAALAPIARAEDGKRYEIEVLVFKIAAPELEGNELWDWEGVGKKAEHIAEAVAVNNKPPQGSALTQIEEALKENDDQYSSLIHKYWTQQIVEEEKAKYIRVSGSMPDRGVRVDGTLKLYSKQYLHADLDIVLSENTGGAAPQTYRVSEHRRIQLGKLYYIDHPKFGVVLQIK